MNDQLVQSIGAFSFDLYTRYGSESSDRYHDFFLKELEVWLKANGYWVSREKTIMYKHTDRKSGAICSMRGLIDLYAKNKDHKVAVEFDNGKKLKFKSIEKMNNSDADILVGVVVGGSGDSSVRNNNQRYSEMTSINPSVNKDVWLIVLSESRIELMSVRKKALYGPKSLKLTKADGGIKVQALTGEKEHQQRIIEEY